MENEILFYRRERYGVMHTYIAFMHNERMTEIASAIRCLTGRITLTDSDVRNLETLGFKFKQVFMPENC